MTECKFLKECPFFNDQLPNMPDVADKVKMIFCRHYFALCGRYMIASSIGRKYVPANLLPGDKEKAEEIILKKSNSR